MLTISGFAFNTLTFGYFYDHFVRSRRMKKSEKNKAIYLGIRGRTACYQLLAIDIKMPYAISVAVAGQDAERGQPV
jgi:hypothetical protein